MWHMIDFNGDLFTLAAYVLSVKHKNGNFDCLTCKGGQFFGQERDSYICFPVYPV